MYREAYAEEVSAPAWVVEESQGRGAWSAKSIEHWILAFGLMLELWD